MKECISNDNTDDIKDILKIRLHMWNVKENYQNNDEYDRGLTSHHQCCKNIIFPTKMNVPIRSRYIFYFGFVCWVNNKKMSLRFSLLSFGHITILLFILLVV